jgi:hypothetical protein
MIFSVVARLRQARQLSPKIHTFVEVQAEHRDVDDGLSSRKE